MAVRTRSRWQRLNDAIANYKATLREGIAEVINDASNQLYEDLHELHFEIEDWAQKYDGTNLENSATAKRIWNCVFDIDEAMSFVQDVSVKSISLEKLVPDISKIEFPSMFAPR